MVASCSNIFLFTTYSQLTRCPSAAQTRIVEQANPEGIPSQSPGFRAASYPGKRESAAANPNGVAASSEDRRPQPRWGWHLLAPFTQGSSRLATLGWRTQSLRDCAGNGRLVGNAQPGKEGEPLARRLRPPDAFRVQARSSYLGLHASDFGLWTSDLSL